MRNRIYRPCDGSGRYLPSVIWAIGKQGRFCCEQGSKQGQLARTLSVTIQLSHISNDIGS